MYMVPVRQGRATSEASFGERDPGWSKPPGPRREASKSNTPNNQLAQSTGEVAERSNAADCKSVALVASKVRVLPSPPAFARGSAARCGSASQCQAEVVRRSAEREGGPRLRRGKPVWALRSRTSSRGQRGLPPKARIGVRVSATKRACAAKCQWEVRASGEAGLRAEMPMRNAREREAGLRAEPTGSVKGAKRAWRAEAPSEREWREGGSNSVVESQPSKLLVAGSIPVSRSSLRLPVLRAGFGSASQLTGEGCRAKARSAKADAES